MQLRGSIPGSSQPHTRDVQAIEESGFGQAGVGYRWRMSDETPTLIRSLDFLGRVGDVAMLTTRTGEGRTTGDGKGTSRPLAIAEVSGGELRSWSTVSTRGSKIWKANQR